MQPDHLELSSLLEVLVGKCCTEVYGGCFGSHAIILLGATKTRHIERNFGGQIYQSEIHQADYEILIRDTNWQILEHDEVIATQDTLNGYDSPMYRAFQMLIGKEVTSGSIDANSNLSVRFTDNFSIRTICQDELEEDQTNYYVVLQNREITVGPDRIPRLIADSKQNLWQ